MQFNQICALLAFAVAVVSAAPGGGHAPPPKPAPPAPPTLQQSNYCGNNVEPYCCNSEEGFGQLTSCVSIGMGHPRILRLFSSYKMLIYWSGQSSTCDGTVVCCNSNEVSALQLFTSTGRLDTEELITYHRASTFALAPSMSGKPFKGYSTIGQYKSYPLANLITDMVIVEKLDWPLSTREHMGLKCSA